MCGGVFSGQADSETYQLRVPAKATLAIPSMMTTIAISPQCLEKWLTICMEVKSVASLVAIDLDLALKSPASQNWGQEALGALALMVAT
mmetsp:Transcript_61694/g.108060  ORF Transcript_61694/g.108060 Transcript_61694/m.108060 type:complete len:89 (+) Transcript_61694:270-536(+)